MSTHSKVWVDFCRGAELTNPLLAQVAAATHLFEVCMHGRCDKKCVPKFTDASNKPVALGTIKAMLDPSFKDKCVAAFLARVREVADPDVVKASTPLDGDVEDMLGYALVVNWSDLDTMTLWYKLPQDIQARLPLRIMSSTYVQKYSDDLSDLTSILPSIPEQFCIPDLSSRDTLQWVVDQEDPAVVENRFGSSRVHMLARWLLIRPPFLTFDIQFVEKLDKTFFEDFRRHVGKSWQAAVVLAPVTDEDVSASPVLNASSVAYSLFARHGLTCDPFLGGVTVEDFFRLPKTPRDFDQDDTTSVKPLPDDAVVWRTKEHTHHLPQPEDGKVLKISTMCISLWPCIHHCTFESGKVCKVDGRKLLRILIAQDALKDTFWLTHINHLQEYADPDKVDEVRVYLKTHIKPQAQTSRFHRFV
jgi:hypothetical protein